MNIAVFTVSGRETLRHAVLCFVLLFLVAAFETWTDADMFIQRLFYDGTQHAWWITPDKHRQLTVWFYRGPKIVLGIAGVVSIGLFLLTFLRPHWRSLRLPCLFFGLSLALVPLVIAGGKQITNIYCPKELTEFGGKRTYQRILGNRSQGNDWCVANRCQVWF